MAKGVIHTTMLKPRFVGAASTCSPNFATYCAMMASGVLPAASCVLMSSLAGMPHSHCGCGHTDSTELHPQRHMILSDTLLTGGAAAAGEAVASNATNQTTMATNAGARRRARPLR